MIASAIFSRNMHHVFRENRKPTDSTKKMSKPRTQKSVSIHDKYNVIMDLQKELKNNAVVAKYGIPKNTVSTWKKIPQTS